MLLCAHYDWFTTLSRTAPYARAALPSFSVLLCEAKHETWALDVCAAIAPPVLLCCRLIRPDMKNLFNYGYRRRPTRCRWDLWWWPSRPYDAHPLLTWMVWYHTASMCWAASLMPLPFGDLFHSCVRCCSFPRFASRFV